MILRVPSYYKTFQCIADKCEHSCCIGWEIDIDEDSYDYYMGIEGALNKLGLSTQVPVVWSYISDGPYRKFAWDNVNIEFKHRTNRQISFMSESTTLVVEAIKTLGKERIHEGVINNLKNRVPEDKRKQLLEEATGVSEWIYEVIRKVCLE